MSTLVAVLLAVALMAALLAVALGTGILQFRPPDGGQAVISPTPTAAAMPTPDEPTPEPIDEPSPPASPQPQPTPGDSPEPGETAQPAPGGTHIVQPGETLFSIGLLYGVPYLEIAAANDMENPDLLRVGQELIIPIPASITPPPGVHVVASGESITSIAELYDVDPTDLADLNGIENWDLIFVGQHLLIPGLAEPSPSPEP
jgi:LysM repeat protein